MATERAMGKINSCTEIFCSIINENKNVIALGTATTVPHTIDNITPQNSSAMLPSIDGNALIIGPVLGKGSSCIVSKVIPNEETTDKLMHSSERGSLYDLSLSSSCNRICLHHERMSDNDDEDDFDDDHHDEEKKQAERKRVESGELDNTKSNQPEEMTRQILHKILSRRKHRDFNSCHYYVLKRIRPELESLNPKHHEQALKDLEFESKLLSTLDHPNIVSIHGISQLGASDFIILERLETTLAQRIEGWRKIERGRKTCTKKWCGVLHYWPFFSGSSVSSFKICFARTNLKRRMFLESYIIGDRIAVALDLASVLEYLHQNAIIYRDLKPSNIGFDITGTLKLFDFGMAKQLLPEDLANDGINYHLTALSGTLRYMAPEVGLGMPYNTSADVYSWAIIFWYLLSLKVPYGKSCTYSAMFDEVFGLGARPPIFESWSESISDLLERAWDSESSNRPSFSEICSILSSELVDCASNNSCYSKEQQECTCHFDPEEVLEKNKLSPRRILSTDTSITISCHAEEGHSPNISGKGTIRAGGCPGDFPVNHSLSFSSDQHGMRNRIPVIARTA